MSAFKLTLNNVSVAYGKCPILHDISFSLTSGQVIGLLGNSGSGKTTLLNTLAGLLPQAAAASGSIYWNSCQLLHNPQQAKLRGKKIAMLPQHTGSSLFPLQTIREHFYLTLQAFGSHEKELVVKKASELLAALHFDQPAAILDSYPFQLSGGMQQRVCLALCLLLEPQLLLADEPTSGLDVMAQNELLQQLQALRKCSDSAMLITSHNPGFLCRIADHIIVMHQGRIIETAPPDQLYQHPKTDYTRQLLAAVPRSSV